LKLPFSKVTKKFKEALKKEIDGVEDMANLCFDFPKN
jgi:hypothetical protein